mmetsp:Transcript_45113/g.125091  ORF Transcript_45113/g.125091 Transcript_45113/m.125091 type:complete len:283 (-) Transcript_45113:684-1532(-)
MCKQPLRYVYRKCAAGANVLLTKRLSPLALQLQRGVVKETDLFLCECPASATGERRGVLFRRHIAARAGAFAEDPLQGDLRCVDGWPFAALPCPRRDVFQSLVQWPQRHELSEGEPRQPNFTASGVRRRVPPRGQLVRPEGSHREDLQAKILAFLDERQRPPLKEREAKEDARQQTATALKLLRNSPQMRRVGVRMADGDSHAEALLVRLRDSVVNPKWEAQPPAVAMQCQHFDVSNVQRAQAALQLRVHRPSLHERLVQDEAQAQRRARHQAQTIARSRNV